MRSRTPTLVLVIALLAAAAAVPIFAAGQQQQQGGQVVGTPDLTVSTSSGSLRPGTTSEISLAVTNRARIQRAGPEEYENRVTTARGTIVRVRSGNTPIRVNTGSLAVGSVPDGATSSGSVSLTVPQDIEPGTYELPVTFKYSYTHIVNYGTGNPEYRDQTISRDGTLTIEVDDGPTFEVVNRSSSALVGQTGQVSVALRNTGTEPATDSRATITSGSASMTFAGGSESATAFTGEWETGETKTVSYEATIGEDADPGSYSADISVAYTDQEGVEETSRTMTLGLPVGNEQSFAFRDIDSSLRAGFEGTLSGTLINEGPNTVRNPVAVLSASNNDITITSPEQALPDLEPDEETRVNFSVDVSRSATAERQQFQLSVEYDTLLGDRRTTSPIRPRVSIGASRDRFAVEPVDPRVAAGSNRGMVLNVTNQGDERLSEVEAKAYMSSPLSSDDDEGIIADLAPGETKQIVIDVGAGSSALEKQYPVNLDFRYERPNGETEISSTYKVLVSVTGDDGGEFPIMLLVGVVALGIGGVFLYRRRAASER